LKVQWDEHATIHRPERVSPWEIEPFVATASLNPTQPVPKSKRPRPVEIPSSEITTNSAASIWYHGSTQSADLTQIASTAEVQSSDSQVVWPLRHKDINSGNYFSSMVRSDGIWPSSPHVNISLNLFPDPTEDNKTVSTRCMLTGYASPVSSMPINGMIHEKEEKGTQSDASVGCWLFGINLTGNCSAASPPEREPMSSVMVCSGAEGSAATPAPEVDKAQNHQDVSKLSMKQKRVIFEPSPKESQSKQGMMLSSRTRTKVQMQGVAVGRAVDLNMLKGYEDLIDELEKMFEIKGELRPPNKWAIVFTDDENDMMLVGDDPWVEFCKMVKKIFIFSSEEVKKMKKFKVLASSLECEGTVVSLDSEHRA
jgi:auxin response factor